MKQERDFQGSLIDTIKERFPGCMVLKNDSSYIQGIPDLTILYNDRWVILECKKSPDEPYRPNQEHYLELLNGMSYAATIFPENAEVILNEVQEVFRA